MQTTMRKLFLGMASLLSLFIILGLSACSGSSEEEKQAGGYYEGPMQPKSERVGSPAQQQGGQ
mgnify:CR=1 FL=1